MSRLLPLLGLVFAAACSDYNLGDTPGDGQEGDPEGDIEVSPLTIDLGRVCDGAETEVTIRNVGDASLRVTSLLLTGEGWSIPTPFVPEDLAPGASMSVFLLGSGGVGTLSVYSEDPDEPKVDVSLAAVANQAPIASILSPSSGSLFSEGQDVTVSGQVQDPDDAPETLQVEWFSDVDGSLALLSPEPSGDTSWMWPGATRTSGVHNLVLWATDSCGVTGSDTVNVCSDQILIYDPLDLATWHYEGDAVWDGASEWLQITSTGLNLVGSAFETSTLISGSHVEIQFQFFIGGGTGADGFSLTVLDSARMTGYLGGIGCGIGYGGSAECTPGPALPGWTLAVDTYDNGFGIDPTPADHIKFTFDGDVDGYQAWAVLPEMEDTGWHQMEVVVDEPHVTAAVDGVTYIDQDLVGTFSFLGYVGFTAGTGDLTNFHRIEALQVTDHACK